MLNIKFIKEALSFYYELNDSESHGYQHLDNVYELAINMKAKLNIEIPNNIIGIAAYTHDMFSSINRKLHHELAYKYVLDTSVYFLNDLHTNDRYLIACAVREHRASYQGEYTSILSELLSAADRGKPDIKSTIIRSYKYSAETNPDANEFTLYSLVREHMLEKFSTNGYARYNDVYNKYFKDELKEMQEFFDIISVKDIENIIKENNNG